MTPMHLLSAIWLAGAMAGQEPATTPTSQANRTAEARLKEVFLRMGQMDGGQVRIDIASREDSKLPFYPEAVMDVAWRRGGGFRVVLTGSWGNTMAFVSDGKTLLKDPMDIASGVILKNSAATLFESDADLAERGGVFSPLFYFLAGDKGFDALVAKDGDIVGCPGEAGEEGIRFKSAKSGTMRVYFDPKDRDLRIRRVDFDNLDSRVEMAERLAEWGVEPPVDPLDVHTYTYHQSGTPNQRLFRPDPPKGLTVHDERKKASDSPPPNGPVRA